MMDGKSAASRHSFAMRLRFATGGALMVAFGPAAVLAGPVTTVPWNGKPGAVSFTYDDARPSQITTLFPQLDELKIKATFFIAVTGAGGNFEAKKPEWTQHAKNGHEMANHVKNHANVPADPAAAPIIAEMATYLRAVDPTVEGVTFAYPNCNVNGKTGVGSENFIARSCGGARYAWGTQPADWMNVNGMILGTSSAAITGINSAKSGNSWQVLLTHEVKENPTSLDMSPAENKKMLDAAVAAGVWIETFQTVGAYYRAHFAMDEATATATASGWSMAWTSPHPKLPKVVKLRVKLDPATFGSSFTVRQGGAVIPAETDGSYVIDFMKLALTVDKGITGVASRLPKAGKLGARPQRNGIAFDGVSGEVEAVVSDIRGAVVFRGRVHGGLVPLREADSRGLLFLTLMDRAAGTSVRAMVNAAR